MTVMSNYGRSYILAHDSFSLMLKVTDLFFTTLISMLNPGKRSALSGNPDMIRSLALNASQQEFYTGTLIEIIVIPVRASACRVGIASHFNHGTSKVALRTTGYFQQSKTLTKTH